MQLSEVFWTLMISVGSVKYYFDMNSNSGFPRLINPGNFRFVFLTIMHTAFFLRWKCLNFRYSYDFIFLRLILARLCDFYKVRINFFYGPRKFYFLSQSKNSMHRGVIDSILTLFYVEIRHFLGMMRIFFWIFEF